MVDVDENPGGPPQGLLNLTPESRRRLVISRYLFATRESDRQQPDPLHGLSLLRLHDAIEFVLLLLADAFQVKAADDRLMALFGAVDDKLVAGGARLPMKEQVRSLNKARAAIKHEGALPSRHDTEQHWTFGEAFLSETTLVGFGVAFLTISIVELVQNKTVRGELITAEDALRSGRRKECQQRCALAFYRLLAAAQSPSRIHPFSRLSRGTAISPLRFGLGHDVQRLERELQELESRMANDARDLHNYIVELDQAFRVLRLGINPSAFNRFAARTPVVIEMSNEIHYLRDPEATDADLRFCVDFIVASALTIQASGVRLGDS
jgi:hypothetical protein